MIPNHPAIERTERTGSHLPPFTNPKLYERPIQECDCGSIAKLRIRGNLRCWECAEDEGVKKL